MKNVPWLLIAGLVPLVGTALIAIVPRKSWVRGIALGTSLVTLAVVIAMATQFQIGGPDKFQFVTTYSWIPAFGVSFTLGVDGIGLVLVALAACLVPVVLIASWRDVEPPGSIKSYFGLMLVLQSMIIWVFSALDVFLFYLLFEAMLIPAYLLIGRFGGAQRSYAAMKFLLYSLFGGLIMLAALIGLYVASQTLLGNGTFDFQTLSSLQINTGLQNWLFLGFFLAFAIKAPLWPLHTWLPDAASEATPGTAVMLVALMDKVGTFGMIRYCLQLFPDASRTFAFTICILAVVSIVYGALVAIGQTDIMRLISYTSVSHFGFIIIGIFAFTTQGQTGSVFYMVAHGFSTAALFLIAGVMMARGKSRNIADYGGVFKVAPLLAGFVLIAGLSGLALPGMASFPGEFLVLVGSFLRYPVLAIIATVAIVLSAVYILWLYQRVATGEPRGVVTEKFGDLRSREVWVFVPIVAVMIALGVYPQAVTRVIEPAVQSTLDRVGAVNPEPTALKPAESTKETTP